MCEISIFISHSSKDVQLVEGLIQSLQQALELPNNILRCTSVPGYELAPGSPSTQTIRQELSESSIVIGVLTPNSIRAAWPLYELGAAWGQFNNPIVLLAGGLTYNDVDGPLGDTQVLRIDLKKDLFSLIDEISNRLDISKRPTNAIYNAIDTLVRRPEHRVTEFAPSEILLIRSELIDPINKLQWADIEKDCISELFIWGWACRNVIGGRTRYLFKSMAEKGIDLNFMVMNPDAIRNSLSLDFGAICDETSSDKVDDIIEGINSIRNFYSNLHPQHRRHVHLRTTNWIMTWSGIAIDPKEDNGRIQIELFYYLDPFANHRPLDSRPEIILNKKSRYYTGFWNSINVMWNNSQQMNLDE